MDKKNYNISFTVIMIVLMAYMFLNSFRYNRNIERLNTKIETLTEEVECYEALNDFNNRYQEELESQLDSLNKRYQIFETPPARNMIDIINAIMEVESSGDSNAYNPKEDAVGILQIRRCMVDDVNRILKRKQSDVRYSYSDRWNIQKSHEMFRIFCDYYGLTTAEEMARCWNGGPRGINNPYTMGYWNKVEDILVSNE
tara:strand:- start:137 stop:733 length:597 start_codon:yes stop_codon:yes gene_type:complete